MGPLATTQKKTEFSDWTREALEAEIVSLRANMSDFAKERAKPIIAQATQAQKDAEELKKELKDMIASVLAVPAQDLLKFVKDLTEERIGLFGLGRKLTLGGYSNYDISYHYRELKRALNNAGFSA